MCVHVCVCMRPHVCGLWASPVISSSRTYGNLCQGEPCTPGTQPRPAVSPGRPPVTAHTRARCRAFTELALPPPFVSTPNQSGRKALPGWRQHLLAQVRGCQSSFVSEGPGHTDCVLGKTFPLALPGRRADPGGWHFSGSSAPPQGWVGCSRQDKHGSIQERGTGQPLGIQFRHKETQGRIHVCTGCGPNLPPPVLLLFQVPGPSVFRGTNKTGTSPGAFGRPFPERDWGLEMSAC